MWRCALVLGVAACADRPPEIARPAPPPVAVADAAAPIADAAAIVISPDDLEPLDAQVALQEAQAKGLRATILVPHAVRCPAIGPPAGDLRRLTATGALAGLRIDLDGFLREDVGVAEVVALLGPPVLCSGGHGSGYLNMHLAPRDRGVEDVAIETRDGDLIGVVIRIASPVTVEPAELVKRYGPTKTSVSLHGPISDTFQPRTAAFSAILMFRRLRDAPPEPRRIDEVILRRTAMIEILPDRFESARDLARLARLALRPRAPDTVDFYGTLGAFDGIAGDDVRFTPAPELRNVASASITKLTLGKRHFVRSVRVELAKPIDTDAQQLALELGAALRAPARVVADGQIVVLGGTVRIEPARGPVGTIAIERAR